MTLRRHTCGLALLIAGLLLTAALPALATHQQRDLRHAAVLLYASMDNGVRPDFWMGEDPLWPGQTTGQVTSGAVRNGCQSGTLVYRLDGTLSPQRGTVAFHARLADGQTQVLRIGPVHDGTGLPMLMLDRQDGWLQPAVFSRDGTVYGWPAEVPAGARGDSLGQWHHYAIAWEHTRGVRLYFDGKLVSQDWDGPMPAAWSTPAGPLRMELFAPLAADELFVFDRPLEEDQVDALRQGRLTAPRPMSIRSSIPVRPRRWQPGPSTRVIGPGAGPAWAVRSHQLGAYCRTQKPDWTARHTEGMALASDPRQLLAALAATRQMADALADKDAAWPGEAVGRAAATWAWWSQNPADAARLAQAKQRWAVPTSARPAALDDPRTYVERCLNRPRGQFPVDATFVQAVNLTWDQVGWRQLLESGMAVVVDETARGAPGQVFDTASLLARRAWTGATGDPQAAFPDAVTTWDQADETRVAVLVQRGTAGLHVSVCNFDAQPQALVLRPWQIVRGDYQLFLASDADDDGVPDRLDGAPVILRDRIAGQPVSWTAPTGVSVMQLVPVAILDPLPAARAKAALLPPAEPWTVGQPLTLAAVNLGSAEAADLVVDLFCDQHLIHRWQIASLPPVKDLTASPVALTYTGPHLRHDGAIRALLRSGNQSPHVVAFQQVIVRD